MTRAVDGSWWVAFAALGVLAAGCGEAFTATANEGGGGASGTTGAGATATGDCVPGNERSCYDGPSGTEVNPPCTKGLQKCDATGHWGECIGQQKPGAAELCDDDKVDENCDGSQNEGCTCTPGEPPIPCGNDEGECVKGTQSCNDGMLGPCEGGQGAVPETCNSLDDDCNGVIDNEPQGVNEPCKVDGASGACIDGVTECQGGLICKQVVFPALETCDGIDNDCNGTVDDTPAVGQGCNTGLPGPCGTGKFVCKGDTSVCEPVVEPTNEICDNVDNDCDGTVDDGIDGVGGPCTFPQPNGNLTCSGTLTCNGQNILCIPSVYHVETFFGQANGQWTLNGEWEIGPAQLPGVSINQLGNADPSDDHTNTADKSLAGVVIGGNTSPTQHGPDYLVSPIFNTNKAGNVFLSFFRYLNTDLPAVMVHTVDISTDGGSNWSNLFTNGATIFDASWKPVAYDITNFKSSNTRIRFGVQVKTSTITEVSSWNIDDVAISSCPPGG